MCLGVLTVVISRFCSCICLWLTFPRSYRFVEDLDFLGSVSTSTRPQGAARSRHSGRRRSTRTAHYQWLSVSAQSFSVYQPPSWNNLSLYGCWRYYLFEVSDHFLLNLKIGNWNLTLQIVPIPQKIIFSHTFNFLFDQRLSRTLYSLSRVVFGVVEVGVFDTRASGFKQPRFVVPVTRSLRSRTQRAFKTSPSVDLSHIFSTLTIWNSLIWDCSPQFWDERKWTAWMIPKF